MVTNFLHDINSCISLCYIPSITFDNGITINKMIIQFLSIGGEIGVNCFILISGYFLVDSQFKTKKL